MRPKKSYGQHFLTAPSFAKRIADAVPALPQDNVLEIGPGQGALSIFLEQRFPGFHCVELDTDVLDILKSKLKSDRYTIHTSDVLAFDFFKAGCPLHVTGNLPYSIGAMIIKKTLLYGNDILSCTFMVQREVAERIVSGPNSKTNGFLSIFCSFFGKPKLLFHVPPGAFFPRPKVDSSVFQIIIDKELETKLPRDRWKPFFAFVTKGFTFRRKQLINAFSRKTEEKEMVASVLKQCGIEPSARPENLGIEEWLRFYKKFSE
ncbi:MAG: ribosomal RNA small subunit methyltransferase A [Chitinispirillaceae bacterium]|nr:ribosomal RNA small subunit methyltransferase A [Chitinispirillaceae bacterium]